MNPYKDVNLKELIESISQEEVDKQTQLQDEENERVYKNFINELKINRCFLCGCQMNLFDESKPCFHWFTYPLGIKKKHFEKYLEKPIGFFQLDTYFRWLVNTVKPIVNINDLKDETSETSYLETTFIYKNIEWAFSIGNTDKEGHLNSSIGSTPHYHIQMKVDNRIFLKFNDFHIPFSDIDLFYMELSKQAEGKVKLGHSFGQGISILEDEENHEMINDAMTITDDFENAPFNLQTLITAPEGQTIPGELVMQAIEESRITKQPIGKIIKRLLSDVKTTSIISPGNGIPKMTKRSGKK